MRNKDDKRKLWVRIVAILLAVFLVFGIVFSSFKASAFDNVLVEELMYE